MPLSPPHFSTTNRSPTKQTVRRGNSDTAATRPRPQTLRDIATADEETWRDFLRHSEADSHRTSPGTRSSSTTQHDAGAGQLLAARTSGGPRTSPNTPTQVHSRMKRQVSDDLQRVTHSDISTPLSAPRSNGTQQALSNLSRSAATISISSKRPIPSRHRSSQQSVILPQWQPDQDVTACPVCGTQFGFWYRKHHCRKCGKVVCSNCSQHRITIPRHFIVKPTETAASAPISAATDAAPVPLPAGNETVRVCNPCVPDPNCAPPPQQQDVSEERIAGPSHVIDTEVPRTPTTYISRRTVADQAAIPHNIPPPRRPHAERRRSTLQGFSPRNVGLRTPLQTAVIAATHGHFATSDATIAAAGALTSHSAPHRGQSLIQALRPRRPPIKEEDECPVCGRELPPVGDEGDEAVRQQHVEECIRAYSAPSASTASRRESLRIGSAATHSLEPPSQTLSSSAQDATAASADTHASTMPTAAHTSTPPPAAAVASTPPVRGPVGNRMLVYRATEKDCVGALDDGSVGPQECVICFEEFSEGEDMGRLECLCKFHRVSLCDRAQRRYGLGLTRRLLQTCIRQWWDTRGVGSCPTHQLHD